MIRRRKFLIGLAASGLGHLAAGEAPAGARGTGGGSDGGSGAGWRLLGRAWVSAATAESRIELPRAGRFRALRLRAAGRALRLDRLRLHFTGGAAVDLAEPREVPAGGLSQAIALPGGGQPLAAVDLAWRAEAGTGREPGPLPGDGDLSEVELIGLAA